MEISDQQSKEQRSCHKPLEELETLSLRELFPYWSDLLWRASMRPLLQQMLQVDLTMSESQVLRHLQHRELSISEVAQYLSITHSAASRAVDRLVRDGFVVRAENPEDRRQKQLRLSPRGTELVQNLNNTFTTGIERLVASLSTDEQEQFRLLIAHMLAAYPEEAGVTYADETSVVSEI
jgi:DNA-binding MarR family transcriptional regulator